MNGPEADLDREGVGRYRSDRSTYRRRDPKAAARIGFGIYERVQILLQHPEAGTILDELREGGWHKLIFRRWKIVYTLRGDDIIIGRVWPAAMSEADMETPLQKRSNQQSALNFPLPGEANAFVRCNDSTM